MGKSKLINAEIMSSIADINHGFISMADVKSKEDFFNSVRGILSEYNEQSETHVLDWDPVSDALDEIEYETIESDTLEGFSEALKGQIQIIQANISKKGRLSFEFDPSLGSLVMETEEVCG